MLHITFGILKPVWVGSALLTLAEFQTDGMMRL